MRSNSMDLCQHKSSLTKESVLKDDSNDRDTEALSNNQKIGISIFGFKPKYFACFVLSGVAVGFLLSSFVPTPFGGIAYAVSFFAGACLVMLMGDAAKTSSFKDKKERMEAAMKVEVNEIKEQNRLESEKLAKSQLEESTARVVAEEKLKELMLKESKRIEEEGLIEEIKSRNLKLEEENQELKALMNQMPHNGQIEIEGSSDELKAKIIALNDELFKSQDQIIRSQEELSKLRDELQDSKELGGAIELELKIKSLEKSMLELKHKYEVALTDIKDLKVVVNQYKEISMEQAKRLGEEFNPIYIDYIYHKDDRSVDDFVNEAQKAGYLVESDEYESAEDFNGDSVDADVQRESKDSKESKRSVTFSDDEVVHEYPTQELDLEHYPVTDPSQYKYVSRTQREDKNPAIHTEQVKPYVEKHGTYNIASNIHLSEEMHFEGGGLLSPRLTTPKVTSGETASNSLRKALGGPAPNRSKRRRRPPHYVNNPNYSDTGKETSL